FLPQMTAALPNLAFVLGPAFYFLYYIVPANVAVSQAANAVGMTDIDRIEGLAPACTGAFCFLLGHFGIRGLFEWSKPWRLIFFAAALGGEFFAGFRSGLINLALIFGFQFYFEGLWKTRLLPAVAAFLM